MMPPGHLAVTWGVSALVQKNNPRLANLDYRLLAFAAMAPDIIDKPLALLVFTEAHTSQLIGHSLLPHLLILTLSLLFWRKLLPYTLAFNAHLLADKMWHHTESFWWPVFGWNTFWEYRPVNTPQAMVEVYLDIVTRYPQVWVIELLAIFFLGWFAHRYRLYRPARLKRLLLTGHLVPPRAKPGRLPARPGVQVTSSGVG